MTHADAAQKALRLIEAPAQPLLATHLAKNPALHLYALGDLEEPFYSQCRWWLTASNPDDTPESVTLLFDDGCDGTLMALGEGSAEVDAQRHALEELLLASGGALDRPRLHAVLSQELFDWMRSDPRMQACLQLTHITPLHRMMLANHTSRAHREELSAPDDLSLRPLTTRDEARLRSFLTAHYPETFFNAETLDMGVTIGAWRRSAQGTGELVGVCGVHVFAPREGVAALGHVVVRPDHRGLGLGEAVVKACCGALHERSFAHIGLNVARSNAVARRCYEKLGFEVTHALVECDLLRMAGR